MPGSMNNLFEVSYLYCTVLVLSREELIRVNFSEIIVTTHTHIRTRIGTCFLGKW